ncbi:MAG: DUF4097 family beta strand repeat protein [Gemmatimonadaceae bacterium]|nr:DUF4097 family beta strand repeat protein [Gemmatimonadaceae bacterium]
MRWPRPPRPRPRGTSAISIDGGNNGGARIIAWDRDSIAVFALIQAHARSSGDAEAIARDIRISTERGRIRADVGSTGRNEGASVSYHVYVPRRMDVTARTRNGGISVDGVSGTLDLEANNGGLSIKGAGGDLRGRTTNGGITLTLAGSRWEGRGADLETRNGGVSVVIPERFNARLEASTVNGSFNIDFPITMQGRIGRHIEATIGSGGPTVRAVTTNGGVRIRRA